MLCLYKCRTLDFFLHIIVKEISESEVSDFKPEDVYYDTPEEELERTAKILARYVELNRQTEISSEDYHIMSR